MTTKTKARTAAKAKTGPKLALAETVQERDTAPVETAGSQTPAIQGPMLKKQELINKVVQEVDLKKKDAKPVVEALLSVLGEALAEGRELNLPPLGRLKLNRTKETPNARILICKIRQNKTTGKPDSGAKQTVAAVAE